MTVDPAWADVYGKDKKFHTEIRVSPVHRRLLSLPRHCHTLDLPVFDKKADEQADIVQVLTQHGADVAAQDNTRSTPLHLASS